MMRVGFFLLLFHFAASFIPPVVQRESRIASLFSSVSNDFVAEKATTPGDDTLEDLNELKASLVFVCNRKPKASLQEVCEAVEKVEALGEKIGIGRTSATSDVLSGEWELLWSPEDATRSSPFFWAFRKAFPDNADQIFGITDSIPAPLKEIGPAFQKINFVPEAGTGQFVSKVKVATMGGMATSIMTTRATIVGVDGPDGIRIKIDTTKPEESTVLQTLLGPLGAVVNENLPAFPSGDALEKVQPGSSEVLIRNTYCDDSIRVCRNDNLPSEVYIWRRREFASFEML